ncbi:hypothetical protein [Ferviditalea candida]|uniref:Uncharacterized protein n=1 Tax=Ferviditalea candida TaxID=3108399 RepID=A0ABU5ZGP3_9BACL|nr:hypothetical protein [Paenibacillaceae bacterium T2]
MNEDFIQIKSLAGELKLSHKNKDFGLTVSTKELVYHKPHINYYIMLEDIISIIPFDIKRFKTVSFVSEKASNNEIASAITRTGTHHYKLYVKNAVMHNLSGKVDMGAMEFVIPLYGKLLDMITEYGNMDRI